jgi:superfamily I DNA/RNA helicase
MVIFRFQGASLENFLYFQSKFPEAKIVYLENNYRSYQSILDSAGSVIRKNTVALKHDLVATRGKDVKTENGANQQINIISLRTPETENTRRIGHHTGQADTERERRKIITN